MAYLGLAFEFLLFCVGVYLYLFSIGGIKTSNPEFAKRAEAFRQENSRWLRIAALALMAVMFVNLVISIRGLFS